MTVPTLTVTDQQTPEVAARLVVLAPGLGTDVAGAWGPAIEKLDSTWHVIGVDLPGHGHSPASAEPFTMAELAQAVVNSVKEYKEAHHELRDLPTHYAGISLAGAMALQLGLDHPEEFASVAVVCSAAKVGEAAAWEERAEQVKADGTVPLVPGSLERWFAPGFAEKHEDRVNPILDSLRAADSGSYAHLCGVLAGFDLREQLSEVSAPVIAIAGEHDAVTTPELAGFIAENVPSGQHVVIAGVSHQAPAEDPERVAEILADFFGTASA